MAKWPLLADAVCWLVLIVSMLIGPAWITKLSVIILAVCHMLTVLMIYRLASSMGNRKFVKMMQEITNSWDN